MYPALVFDMKKIENNITVAQKLAKQHGIDICAVTKVVCADKEVVSCYYNCGVRTFADPRLENLEEIPFSDISKWLLRLPMISEAKKVVSCSNLSLNSEISTIKALSKEAVKLNKVHKIILMIDVGDLREGVMANDAVKIAQEIVKLEGVQLVGVGANHNCFGGVIPSEENQAVLVDTANEIEKACGIELSIISGGNSGSFQMMLENRLPKKVNQLRLGEAVLFGAETSYQKNIPGLKQDCFKLQAEIIELKKKPSKPIGVAGLNAFGEKVEFEDKGPMVRAIVAVGKQDSLKDNLEPIDTEIEIIGGSSDHTILDLTRAATEYKVGDIVEFKVNYGSLLSLTTSKYVSRIYS